MLFYQICQKTGMYPSTVIVTVTLLFSSYMSFISLFLRNSFVDIEN